VRVGTETPIVARCRCSRERIQAFLNRFSASDLEGMREEDGGVTVKCEFCSKSYRFSAGDIAG
jgi:molecular chaperone Hsp33